MLRPHPNHILQVPDSASLRFQIGSYEDLTGAASGRTLADTYAKLNQTIALSYDADKRTFVVSQKTRQSQFSDTPVTSRIWSDYKFQEIGEGAKYLQLEAVNEKRETASASDAGDEATSGGNDDASEVAAREHPHLSPEKVKRVDRWVTDAMEKSEVDRNAEPAEGFQHELRQPKRAEKPAPEQKRVPGIKKRTVMAVAQPRIVPPPRAPEAISCSPPLAVSVKNKNNLLAEGAKNKEAVANPDTGSTYMADDEMGTDVENGNPRSGHTTPRNNQQTAVGAVLPGSPPKRQMKSPSAAAPFADLLDLASPAVSVTSAHLDLVSFDQPALTPTTPKTATSAGTTSDNDNQRHRNIDPTLAKADGPKREDKYASLKLMLQNLSASAPHPKSPPVDIFNDEIGESDECVKERMQEIGETVPPNKLHRTMDQKSAKSDETPVTNTEAEVGRQLTLEAVWKKADENLNKKAESKAQKQLTLEDAWGIIRKTVKDPVLETPKEYTSKPEASAASAEESAGKAPDVEPSVTTEKPPMNEERDVSDKRSLKERTARQTKRDKEIEEKICEFFAALKSALDSAQSFPGLLTFEMQVGLILIPNVPKACKGNTITSDGWDKIFRPRGGVRAPSARFVRRVTSSGADADYILDLKAAKSHGGGRMFEEKFSDYGVVYEFYCRTKDKGAIVITIDEGGNVRIRQSDTFLGAVNVHFPLHTWDASGILKGTSDHVRGVDSTLDDAIDDIIGSVWVQPGRSLIRIFCQLPREDSLQIEKVLMKRWTRHRYIRPGEANLRTESAVGERKTDMVPAWSGKSRGDDSTVDSDEHRPEIFLKITEVHDLLTGVHPTDSTVLRARCVTREEMARKERLWYEFSVVSSTIEEILQSNASIELGETTHDWSSVDLLGNETHLAGVNLNAAANPLAAAIGNTGIGEMYRVVKMIVERIDGVGQWDNSSEASYPAGSAGAGVSEPDGLAPTLARVSTPAPANISIPRPQTTMYIQGLAKIPVRTPPMTLVPTSKPKSQEILELRSVKELDSASVRAEKHGNDESFW
jgi:hypothetical protein